MGTKLGVEVKYVSATQYEAGCDALENLEEGELGLIGFLMNGLVDELNSGGGKGKQTEKTCHRIY